MLQLIFIALLQAATGDMSAPAPAMAGEVTAAAGATESATAPEAAAATEAVAAPDAAAATETAVTGSTEAAQAAPAEEAAPAEAQPRERRRRCRREHVTGQTRPVRVCD